MIASRLSESDSKTILALAAVRARHTPKPPARAPYAWQAPPMQPWDVWVLLGGRGTGKTEAGARYVDAHAAGPACLDGATPHRIAIVAPSHDDAVDTCVRGETGLLSINRRIRFRPGAALWADLTWPNGAEGMLFGTFAPEDVERFRGPQHCLIWGDEFAAWRKLDEVWPMIEYGLRLGSHPHTVLTTTPKRRGLLKQLLGLPTTVTTSGRTADAYGLPEARRAALYARYGGTSMGRQELDAEMIEDTVGALWRRGMIEMTRAESAPELARIVVAIDPSATSSESADEAGIIVVGLVRDHGYVLEDVSLRGSPATWGREAVAAYHRWGADRIIAETNNGGEMVEYVIRSIDPDVAYTSVTASRGKLTRAEPISALYEQGRVHHVGTFPLLEDQMCLAGGTRIDTARGWLPIEQVEAGDEVWTRQGWKPVTWAGPTGYVQTMTIRAGNRVIRCTPSHPVFVERRGFVPAGEVQTNDIILACHVRPSALASSSAASATTATTTATTSPAALAGVGSSIGTFGQRLMATFRQALTFTTWTTIAATTPSTTSMPSAGAPTSALTESGAHGHKAEKSKLLGLGRNGQPVSLARSSAAGVATRSDPRECERRTAHAVVGSVTTPSGPPEFVYNLTVADAPEFYAEGLLVHNCSWAPGEKSPDRMDALVWGLTHLLATDNPWAQLTGRRVGAVA